MSRQIITFFSNISIQTRNKLITLNSDYTLWWFIILDVSPWQQIKSLNFSEISNLIEPEWLSNSIRLEMISMVSIKESKIKPLCNFLWMSEISKPNLMKSKHRLNSQKNKAIVIELFNWLPMLRGFNNHLLKQEENSETIQEPDHRISLYSEKTFNESIPRYLSNEGLSKVQFRRWRSLFPD